MTSNWVVAVLSTDYDLHEHRTAVINLLKDKGVVPSAFETPDFPVAPGMHSHDDCLAALKRVDAAILIIDKRAGGVYIGSDEHTSITEQEYIEIAKLQKPYFVFVSKGAWNERHNYRTQLHGSGKTETEFDVDYKDRLSYVSSIDVIHFIDHIQNAYKTYGTSNWICQFEGIDELKNAIEGKFAGLSQYFCYKIAEQQAEKIRNRKTSTSMMLSLGDVFSRGYYVEPDVTIESGSLPIGDSFDDKVVHAILNNHATLVIGEAGYGKTTILAKSFLSHFDKCEKTDYEIPFYINLKSRGSAYHFDFSKYIEECFEEYLGKSPYPYTNLDSIKAFFYLDSFDELAEKIATQDLHIISLSTIFSRPFLLTCRNQFAMRYIRSNEFSGKIANVVRVNRWSRDKATGYIQNFCSINDKPELLANISGLLTDNQELCDILDNPLLITMLLWVIEQNGLTVPATIKNRVQLFSECLKELAFREIERLNIVGLTEETMLLIWSSTAWEVYYAKLRRLEIQYSDLLPKLQEKYPSVPGIADVWFETLFSSNQLNIAGTFHEQFLEYLSANAILIACLEAKTPFPEFLKEVVRPEINRYFRALWNEKNSIEKAEIISNIKKLYNEKLLLEDDSSVMQRIHAIYHLSRLNFDGKTAFINSVLCIEPNISVKISMYFGAIKIGLLDKEAELYQLLSENTDYSDSNRGYHLAYYGDIVAADKLPFKDDITANWPSTLNAFLRHFQSEEDGHYFLWRIDLLTMRQLMIERNAPLQIDEGTLKKIDILINNPPNNNYPDFQKLVIAEFNELNSFVNSNLAIE